MKTLARITFWYQGAMHRRKIKNNTVDAYINVYETEDKQTIHNEADNSLSKMIARGLVDAECDAGVSDFGVQKVSFKFKGEADYIF